MPVTVTVEDGTGVADANSYASVAQADNYFASRPRSSSWTPLTDDQKGQYLIHATRLLDASVIWSGEKVDDDQALQWPRHLDASLESEFPPNIPVALLELAYALIGKDLTKEPAIAGYERVKVGPIEVEADPGSRPASIPRFVRDLIAPYGTARANALNATLTRC